MKKVDETIEVICEWINKELENPSPIYANSTLPEMIKALAELMSARAKND